MKVGQPPKINSSLVTSSCFPTQSYTPPPHPLCHTVYLVLRLISFPPRQPIPRYYLFPRIEIISNLHIWGRTGPGSGALVAMSMSRCGINPSNTAITTVLFRSKGKSKPPLLDNLFLTAKSPEFRLEWNETPSPPLPSTP